MYSSNVTPSLNFIIKGYIFRKDLTAFSNRCSTKMKLPPLNCQDAEIKHHEAIGGECGKSQMLPDLDMSSALKGQLWESNIAARQGKCSAGQENYHHFCTNSSADTFYENSCQANVWSGENVKLEACSPFLRGGFHLSQLEKAYRVK